jgi:hypothetical protein
LRPTVVGRPADPRGARERGRGTVGMTAGSPRQDVLRCSSKGSSGRAACGPSTDAGEGRHVRPPSTCVRETRDCASASYGWVDTCASRKPPDRAGARTTPLSPLAPAGQGFEPPRARRFEGTAKASRERFRDRVVHKQQRPIRSDLRTKSLPLRQSAIR